MTRITEGAGHFFKNKMSLISQYTIQNMGGITIKKLKMKTALIFAAVMLTACADTTQWDSIQQIDSEEALVE